MIYDKGLQDLIGEKRGPRMTLGRLIAMARYASRQAGRGPVMERPERLRDGRMLLPVPRGIARQLASRG